MTTVAANEAIVLHGAKGGYGGAGGVSYFGMNPGLIPTGIRSFIYGNGILAWILEGIISLFSPSVDTYAARVVPLLAATDLEAHNGTMFGQKITPILPDVPFADPAYTAKWISGMDGLLAKANVQ